ncbi:MAG: glycoside hydrolase family 99-like domain-containing protein [Armatimonadetes bacterium]|nr:glycoside hydrolase family 99-like domain-containing protein [Armatimonadota bacterium]
MLPRLLCVLLCCALALSLAQAQEVVLRSFQPRQPLCRAGRPFTLVADIANDSAQPANFQATLLLPDGVKLSGGTPGLTAHLPPGEERELTWEALAAQPGETTLKLQLTGALTTTVPLTMRLLPALPVRKLPTLPEPQPAPTQWLIGAHHCPLWEADKPRMWSQVVNKHLERMPALGLYNQENPEVSDWETKWAVEHGVSFFIYCWYRASQGGPVTTRFSSAIEQALFHSRFEKHLKWTIMWENQSRGTAGVADERDLMANLLPYWINNYFQRDSYLKVDGKPVLFIYRPEFLIQDLGGAEQVRAAFGKMRQACRDAGFAGLHLLGEYRGLDPRHLELMKQLGLDYTFAYCWHVQNNPTPQQAIDAQMGCIRKTQELGILPQVVTVSQAWSGWRDEGSIWKIPPAEYEGLLRQAKDFASGLPQDQLGSHMLLLDNWNEWGEGHYIAPYREYGFGYLDAVRKVFSTAPEPHTDLIPEDIGLGPYDTAIRTLLVQEKAAKKLAGQRVTMPGGDAPGLVAWWTFDEADDSIVALDYTGHGLGGAVVKATRAPGRVGRALVCEGGSVTVPPNPALSPAALTVACWVKTDLADQSDKWMVNHIYSGGTNTGYRLGLAGGRPSFGVPVTSFSPHLTGDKPLPTGRWVHLAGTFDGQTMRLYMDDEQVGALDRPGPAKPNALPLCLGSYEAGHRAFFTGLLDEVKLYDRALTAEEVKREATR